MKPITALQTQESFRLKCFLILVLHTKLTQQKHKTVHHSSNVRSFLKSFFQIVNIQIPKLKQFMKTEIFSNLHKPKILHCFSHIMHFNT